MAKNKLYSVEIFGQVSVTEFVTAKSKDEAFAALSDLITDLAVNQMRIVVEEATLKEGGKVIETKDGKIFLGVKNPHEHAKIIREGHIPKKVKHT